MNRRLHPFHRAALIATLAAVLASPVPAGAQDRLTLGTWEVASSGGDFGATLGPAGALAGQLAAGGRYGLLYDRMIDRATGAAVEFGSLQLATLTVDRARPRAFLARSPNRFFPPDAVVMADLRTGALTPLLSLPGMSGGFPSARFAVDAERLVVSYPDAGGVATQWAVVDLAGGTPAVRNLSLPSVFTWGAPVFAIAPDGTRLYRAEADVPAGTAAVVAYDLATGAETGRVAMPFSTNPRLEWSDALDALLDSRDVAAGGLFTAFSRDLQPVGTAVVPSLPRCGVQAVVSPATGRVYTYTGGDNYFGVPFPSRLTGAMLGMPGPVDVADVAWEIRGSCAQMSVAGPPGAPRRVRASVAGGTVSLAWENVGAASQFTVEVGMVAGRTDLSIARGADSHWTITGVPPGTYFVRIRGANTFGAGRPSAEISVVVP